MVHSEWISNPVTDDYNISYEDLPPPRTTTSQDTHSFPPPPPPFNQDVSQIQNQAMAQSQIVLVGNATTASNPTSSTPKPTPAQSNSKQTNSLKNNSYYSWRDEKCTTDCPPNCNSGMQAGYPRM